MDPPWLAGHDDGYVGTVVDFIPRQHQQPAAVVELDEELTLPDGAGAVRGPVAGRILVLELGHAGTDWSTRRPRVHVELCGDRPERRSCRHSAQGAWVESHATYERVEE
jgi:hypothetical protein